jgi:thymidylate synthase (FAD)
MRQRHTSPFEMCEIKLHVKLPIFVARQWIRHRTANVNEYSARYSILDREFYLPDRDLLKVVKAEIRPRAGVQERLFAVPPAAEVAAQSTVNKQGREGNLESAAAAQAVRAIKRNAETAFTVYEKLLGEAEDGLDGYGIARELARMVLPLNAYTQWYWKVDLHNLLHFLRLRHDAHAQYEIRAYAEVLLSEVLRRWVPASCAAFEQYRVHGRELSAGALEALRRRLRGERVSRETVGLGVGEWRELVELFPELAES